MASAMLWVLGALFLGLAPFVTSSTSESVERGVRFAFGLLGALCWVAAS